MFTKPLFIGCHSVLTKRIIFLKIAFYFVLWFPLEKIKKGEKPMGGLNSVNKVELLHRYSLITILGE